MRVEIEYGETVNAGNFESIRVACRIEGSFETEEERIDQQNLLYAVAKKFVQKKIVRELKRRNE